ncbi:MAG: hypothetical protein EAX91_04235 [Candidatus Lokiarchaeota archaeon]|nr:hypothetical protein [Candidatus Lokiarchaeota archaeon]
MNDNKSSQKKKKTKLPTLKENPFVFRTLSMREFETLLILLRNDGIEQSILKILIDQEFGYESETKGYDHIRILCKKKIKDPDNAEKYITNPKCFAQKKKIKENGRNVTRIYVEAEFKKKYEKYMLSTISNLDDSVNEIIQEYIEGIREEDKVREKFKAYTETIILALGKLISESSSKSMSSERFQKKVYDTIMRYYRSEVLKYEVFSR